MLRTQEPSHPDPDPDPEPEAFFGAGCSGCSGGGGGEGGLGDGGSSTKVRFLCVLFLFVFFCFSLGSPSMVSLSAFRVARCPSRTAFKVVSNFLIAVTSSVVSEILSTCVCVCVCARARTRGHAGVTTHRREPGG